MSVSALSHKAEQVVVEKTETSVLFRAPLPTIPPRAANRSKYNFGSLTVGVVAATAIVAGFALRSREIFVPGEGIGYKLGLIGGLMMLLLLFYPAFKRTRFFGTGTKAAFWFNWHMLLGVVGPVLIFYHSNFSLGAMNSNVALFAMIMVAGSGVIGRYIYTHIHSNMSGARLDVGGLLAQSAKLMLGMEADVGGSAISVVKAMADFSVKATPRNLSLIGSFKTVITMPIAKSLAQMNIMREVRKAVNTNTKTTNWSPAEAKVHIATAKNHVSEFVAAVSRAAQFTFWERMFSLWHLMHVPLFFLLLVSGVIHVIAVHLY